MTGHDHEHEHSHAHEPHAHDHVHSDGTPCACGSDEAGHTSASAIDPVCGMSVETHGAKHVVTYQGQTYYFCSADCRARFIASPAAFAPAKAAS